MVSVIMPVYNCEEYVGEAIESILSQTFTEFEFIIVDDGSTDETASIVRTYAGLDSRIVLITTEHIGCTAALNRGLSIARGEYIARMDGDDIALPKRFATQVAYMRANSDCVAVGCRVLLIDSEGDPLCFWEPLLESHREIEAAFLEGRGGAIPHPGAMMRHSTLRAVGGYREEFAAAQDVDLFLRLGEHGLLANITELGLKYRQHIECVGHRKHAIQLSCLRAAVAEARERRGLSPGANIGDTLGEPTSVASLRRSLAWAAMRGKNVRVARKHALAELRGHPLSLASWRLLACAVRGR